MSEQYTGRLAPSPTGLLHLGHARTFWVAYERARAAQGKLWLRDEDLDAQRAREDFSVAMKEDLRWLGVEWDAEMRQSERVEFFRGAMQQLILDGRVYPCSCSRRDLQLAVTAPHEDDDEPLYNGTCRENPAGDALVEGTNYRFRVPDGETVTFDDENLGEQRFVAGKDFGDFLVWRKDGMPSYQLACVVDDAAMQITEVVRGRDLLKSTARQILLQRALGFATPKYYHCELMRDDNGIRLAKRHDALSLRALRESGMTPEQVRERLFPQGLKPLNILGI